MRLLLDNCVPYRAKALFVGHDVAHASDRGWGRLQNGELIAAVAADRYDAFVTTDKKIRHEHNLAKLPVPIVELNSRLTRFRDLQSLLPHLPAALGSTARHWFVSVRPDGTLELLAPRPTATP